MSAKRKVAAHLVYPPEHDSLREPTVSVTAPRLFPKRSSGWDPYEVWRTRVKGTAQSARPERN